MFPNILHQTLDAGSFFIKYIFRKNKANLSRQATEHDNWIVSRMAKIPMRQDKKLKHSVVLAKSILTGEFAAAPQGPSRVSGQARWVL